MTFPIFLPWTLPGDFVPLDGFETIAGAEPLAWLGDYCTDSKGLLLAEFRQPNIEALLCALTAASQDVEAAAWSVLTERWLPNARGAQLDGIGEIVAIGRAGWDDTTYAAILAAQILVLRSSSTWADIFEVLRVLGLTLALVTHAEHYPAALLIVLGEVPAIDGAVIFRLLDASRGAGIRLVLEVPESEIADAFTFADADDPTADAARGWAEDDGLTGGVLVAAYGSMEAA